MATVAKRRGRVRGRRVDLLVERERRGEEGEEEEDLYGWRRWMDDSWSGDGLLWGSDVSGGEEELMMPIDDGGVAVANA